MAVTTWRDETSEEGDAQSHQSIHPIFPWWKRQGYLTCQLTIGGFHTRQLSRASRNMMQNQCNFTRQLPNNISRHCFVTRELGELTSHPKGEILRIGELFGYPCLSNIKMHIVKPRSKLARLDDMSGLCYEACFKIVKPDQPVPDAIQGKTVFKIFQDHPFSFGNDSGNTERMDEGHQVARFSYKANRTASVALCIRLRSTIIICHLQWCWYEAYLKRP